MPVNRTALLLALLSTILWAASQVGSSGVINQISPILYIALIEIFFIVIALVYLVARYDQTRRFFLLCRQNKQVRSLLLRCAIAIFLYELSFYLALSEPEKLLAIIVASLWPIFALLWLQLLNVSSPRRLRIQDIVFIALAFAGAALITADRSGFSLGAVSIKVVLLAGLAAVAGGFWEPSINKIIQLARAPSGNSPTVVGSDQLGPVDLSVLSVTAARLIILPLYGITLLLLPHGPISSLTLNLLLIAAAITLFGYVISDILSTIAFARSESANIVSVTYLVPVVATLFFKIAYGTEISVVTLIGLYIVFVSNFFLHFESTQLSPATAAIIVFVLITCGALVVEPTSAKQLVGQGEYGTLLQIVMAAIALALGFLLQRADGHLRDERELFGNLMERISNAAEGKDENEKAKVRGLQDGLWSVRMSRRPITSAERQQYHLDDYFSQGNNVLMRLAFDEWLTSRQAVDQVRESWFLGVLIAAVGLSMVLGFVSNPFLIILSAIGISLLYYLWIILFRSGGPGGLPATSV